MTKQQPEFNGLRHNKANMTDCAEKKLTRQPKKNKQSTLV